MDDRVFKELMDYRGKERRILPPDAESVNELCLYGNGSEQGVDLLDYRWISWICYQLNMLSDLYLSSMRISNLFGENLKLAALTKLCFDSSDEQTE